MDSREELEFEIDVEGDAEAMDLAYLMLVEAYGPGQVAWVTDE